MTRLSHPSIPTKPLRLVVLISGGGTTLRNLLDKIDAGHIDAKVDLVISSSQKASGLRFAHERNIPNAVFERKGFRTAEEYSQAVFDACRNVNSHLVVMAGFLKFVPIPADFMHRVMNIHPALIPAFCGAGMYGHHVHEAVLEYGAKISGCTVHFVDNQYDHGPIILQHVVPVAEDDTPQTLAARVFQAECEVYPAALRLFGAGRLTVEGRCVRITDVAEH